MNNVDLESQAAAEAWLAAETDQRAYAAGLEAVYYGVVNFDQLARRTREVWRRLARYVMRRWKLPVWVALEDVEQELLLGAWATMWKWEPGRGPTLATFTTYNAVDKAKKAAHKWRNAKRSGNKADSAPGRFERPVSSLFTAEEDWKVEARTSTPATQHEDLEQSELNARVLKLCVGWHEKVVIQAAIRAKTLDDVLAGDAHALYACAQRVYASRARKALKIPDERRALRVVVKAASAVRQRFVDQVAA